MINFFDARIIFWLKLISIHCILSVNKDRISLAKDTKSKRMISINTQS